MTINASSKRQGLIIGLFSLYCVGYGALRYVLEGDAWGFLHYNLWLAWIPLIFVSLLMWDRTPFWLRPMLWLAWLLFLPNAPYIITDYIHLSTEKSTLPWFDLVLIGHFALAGFLVGCFSLQGMQCYLETKLNKTVGYLSTGLALALSGVGIVMGRDLRINSKDIVVNPYGVWIDINSQFEFDHLIKIVVYSLTFTVFYLLYIFLVQRDHQQVTSAVSE